MKPDGKETAEWIAGRLIIGTRIKATDRIIVEMVSNGVAIFAGLTTASFDWNLDVVLSFSGKWTPYFIGNNPVANGGSFEKIFDYIRLNYPQDLNFFLFHPEILKGEFHVEKDCLQLK